MYACVVCALTVCYLVLCICMLSCCPRCVACACLRYIVVQLCVVCRLRYCCFGVCYAVCHVIDVPCVAICALRDECRRLFGAYRVVFCGLRVPLTVWCVSVV